MKYSLEEFQEICKNAYEEYPSTQDAVRPKPEMLKKHLIIGMMNAEIQAIAQDKRFTQIH